MTKAIACLCAGVKAGKQRTITQTLTIPATKTAEIGTTRTNTLIITTSTILAPRSTSCTDFPGAAVCPPNGCGLCVVALTENRTYCADSGTCSVNCSSNSDCANFAKGWICVVNDNFCLDGEYNGVCVRVGSCGAGTPFRRAEREIEEVFEHVNRV